MRSGQRIVAIELAAREADEVRSVEPCVLRVDRDKHLHDMVFGQTVEDDRRHRELLVAKVLDVRVERQKTMLTVDRAEDALPLRHLEAADRTARFHRLERQLFIAGDDDGAGNGWKI